MIKNAIYPGTFDPITYGHIDVIKKGLKVVDKIIVAISDGTFDSAPSFTLENTVPLPKERGITGGERGNFGRNRRMCVYSGKKCLSPFSILEKKMLAKLVKFCETRNIRSLVCLHML